MQSVPYRQLLQVWADICGIESDVVPELDATRFNHIFNRLIRRGWSWHRWPELHLLEERRFRPIWMAQAYAIDDEVYHEASDTYYLATDVIASNHEPGSSSRWEAMDEADVEPYVAYEQDGETGFTHINEVWSDSFRTNRTGARRLRWEYDERGVVITEASVPATVWLHLYRRCPRWQGADYSASTAYQPGQLRYFASDEQDYEGDFWLSLDTTTAGQSPFTDPDLWARQEIPDFLGEFIVAGARIAFLKGEGQLEKALAEDGNPLWDLLAEERLKLLAGSAAPRRARVANF